MREQREAEGGKAMKNAASQRRVRAGDDFERTIESALELAAIRGLAWITKRPTPVKIESVTKGGKVTGRLEGSAGVDYVGVLAGGRAIYMEAKSCHEGTFNLRSIRDAQWSEMERIRASGAARVLVVGWVPDTDKARCALGRSAAVCVIPWGLLEGLRLVGDPSVGSQTLAAFADTSRLHWTELLAAR